MHSQSGPSSLQSSELANLQKGRTEGPPAAQGLSSERPRQQTTPYVKAALGGCSGDREELSEPNGWVRSRTPAWLGCSEPPPEAEREASWGLLSSRESRQLS